jgi:N-acetylneuraminate synthase/sialic acid synthase
MAREIRIQGVPVGSDHPCYIIAEIGINHNGSLDLAKQMIAKAAELGVNAVKFQKRTIDKILTRAALDASYDNENSYGATYGEHRRYLEFDRAQYRELKAAAEQHGVHFFASAWDEEAVDFVLDLGCPALKIASADLTNLPLLEYVCRKADIPILISTGMAEHKEVEQAVQVLDEYDKQYCLMQCTSSYPAAVEEINLEVLKSYQRAFPKAVIGYSGHEDGVAISLAARVMGAAMIERHFTLNRAMKGNDHAASLGIPGLQKLVSYVRTFEKARGDGVKRLWDSERGPKKKLAKSLVSARPLSRGTILTATDLARKSPGNGISPARLREVVGRELVRDLEADQVLLEEHLRPRS